MVELAGAEAQSTLTAVAKDLDGALALWQHHDGTLVAFEFNDVFTVVVQEVIECLLVEGLVVEALVDLDTELVVHGLRLHATGVLEGQQLDVFADVVQDLLEIETEEAVLQIGAREGRAVVFDEHAIDRLEHVLELQEAEVLNVEYEVYTALDQFGQSR